MTETSPIDERQAFVFHRAERHEAAGLAVADALSVATEEAERIEWREPVAPKRIRLSRRKGWRKPEGAVVVARPSKWGNPYRVSGSVNAAQAVAQYRDLIERVSHDKVEPRIRHDGLGVWDRDIYANIRRDLGGRDLACWCSLDQPCHADVLLELANAHEEDR